MSKLDVKQNKKSNSNELSISLSSFKSLNYVEKNEKIRDLLKNTTGFRNNLKASELLKIIDYIDGDDCKPLVLNKELLLSKNDNELIISYRKGKIYLNYIFFAIALIIFTLIATYATLFKERLLSVNKDINGDGIPDINIDVDGDGVADTNIDINYDDIPDYNINYRNSGEAIFNVKVNDKYYNAINRDINDDGVCELNCDINNDGIPELNLDIDGDGAAELSIDSEDFGYATLNIDVDGDKVCDINCDTDNDLKCDENCLNFETVKYIQVSNKPVGTIITTTVPTLNISGNDVVCTNLFPTDQSDKNVLKECNVSFKVTNDTEINAKYNLKLVIDKNSFISTNLKYKIYSDNGGGKIVNYTTVPTSTKVILKNINIPSKTTQTYDVSFILDGTNQEQIEDEGRTLKMSFVLGV